MVFLPRIHLHHDWAHGYGCTGLLDRPMWKENTSLPYLIMVVALTGCDRVLGRKRPVGAPWDLLCRVVCARTSLPQLPQQGMVCHPWPMRIRQRCLPVQTPI
jgi:hypothetical protein